MLITSSDFVLNINDISFGVPEPAAWALMIIGFAGLGAGLRMARRKGDEALSAA